MNYKFIGKPDYMFPDLIQGKIYDLEIRKEPNGLLGDLVGLTHPIIIEPIRCSYGSWEAFYNNWEKVK